LERPETLFLRKSGSSWLRIWSISFYKFLHKTRLSVQQLFRIIQANIFERKPLKDLIQYKIFKPAGLKHTLQIGLFKF
jgi:hypothetical protein